MRLRRNSGDDESESSAVPSTPPTPADSRDPATAALPPVGTDATTPWLGEADAPPLPITTPADAPAPTRSSKDHHDKKAPPAAADISSVGVAILPGVPLPGWATPAVAEQAQLPPTLDAPPPPPAPDQPLEARELFAPEPPAEARSDQGGQPTEADRSVPAEQPAVTGPPVPTEPPIPAEQSTAADVAGALPPPNPAHWSAEPAGPVVWGVPDQPALAEPALAEPALAEPATPVSEMGSWDWLTNPDAPAPDAAAPTPGDDVSHAPPPTGPRYELDGPELSAAALPVVADPTTLPPPLGTAVIQESSLPMAATPLASLPVPSGLPVTTDPAGPGTPDVTGETAGPDSDDASPRGARTWILVVGAVVLALAAAAFAAFVSPGFLNSGTTTATAPAVTTPAKAAGLTKQPTPKPGPTKAFRKVAAATMAAPESQYATYTRDGVSATVWVAPVFGGSPDSIASAYERESGTVLGPLKAADPGTRGGAMKCAAASATRTLCFWTDEGVRGAADVSGLGRAAAAGLVAELRVALEPQAPAA